MPSMHFCFSPPLLLSFAATKSERHDIWADRPGILCLFFFFFSFGFPSTSLFFVILCLTACLLGMYYYYYLVSGVLRERYRRFYMMCASSDLVFGLKRAPDKQQYIQGSTGLDVHIHHNP